MSKSRADEDDYSHARHPTTVASIATPGMGAKKIAAFYDDPEKQAYDAWCTNKAYALKRLSLDTSLPWVAQRWARFALHGARGALRAAKRRLTGTAAAVASSSQRRAYR